MQEISIDEERQDLRNYWRVLSRWWWLLTLGLVSAAIAAFFVSQAITPSYVSTAKILVQGGQSPTAFSVGDIQAGRQLAETYGDLIKTRSVLERVTETLTLPYGVSRLNDKIKVGSIRSIIEVKVSDPNPQLAATIANTTAQSFIDDFFARQLTQIAKFQASFSQYGITENSNILASQAAMLTTLSIVEAATPPSAASSPRTRVNVVIAAILGLVIATMIVFVLERIDDSIRSADDLRMIKGLKGSDMSVLSDLGWIGEQRVQSGTFPSILDDKDSRSALSESYKYLTLNVEFSYQDTDKSKSILVTSALPGEGKTTNVTNLAIAMARGGKSVVLVDADLRKPAIHLAFGLERKQGLTNLLTGTATMEEVLHETSVENLRVIPSGPLPPNPTLMLKSNTMREVVKTLVEKADYVFIDSPPVLGAADPLAIAASVDAVILVVDSKKARRTLVERTTQSLQQANEAVLGVLLNKVIEKREAYYYRYYGYQESINDSKDKKWWQLPVQRLTGVFTRNEARERDKKG